MNWQKKMLATGTIGKNRTGEANKKLIGSKELKKMKQGNFNYCTNGKVFVAKWLNNSVLIMASNWETDSPLHNVNCRVKGGIKEATWTLLINSHIKVMGSVDLMDRLLDSYLLIICGKKWY